jgi:hypothetical protein
VKSQQNLNVTHLFGRITELLSRGKINISNIDIVIIHVGTNNISSAQNVDTIISYYGDLIHKLKYKTKAHIIQMYTFITETINI